MEKEVNAGEKYSMTVNVPHVSVTVTIEDDDFNSEALLRYMEGMFVTIMGWKPEKSSLEWVEDEA